MTLPFDKVDFSHIEACADENEFELALAHVVNVLDPNNEFRLMSAARMSLGKKIREDPNAQCRSVEKAVIDTWPHMSSGDRARCVRELLRLLEYRLSK